MTKPFVVETRSAKTKTCDVCGRDLPRSEFRSNGGGGVEVRSTCRVCECVGRKDPVRNEGAVKMSLSVFQTPEERAMNAIRAGQTDYEAAKEIGVHWTTIAEYRRKMGPKYKIIPPSAPTIHRSWRFAQPKPVLSKSEAETALARGPASDPQPESTGEKALEIVSTGASAPATAYPQDRAPAKEIRIEDIQRIICSYSGISQRELLSMRRGVKLDMLRMVGFYVAANQTSYTYTRIGEKFNRDHTATGRWLKLANSALERGDEDFKSALEAVEFLLGVESPAKVGAAE